MRKINASPKRKLTPAEKRQLDRDVAQIHREAREHLDRVVGPRRPEQPTLFEEKGQRP